MSHITDRNHLMAVAEGGIEALRTLAVAWLEEDHAACAPRSSGDGGPISGGGTSDPCEQIATGRDLDDAEVGPPVDMDKYRDRDRLGAELLHVVGKLKRMVEERQPRQTGGPCRCCEDHTATHGRDEHGRPWACHACFVYWRSWGRTCNVDADGQPSDQVHKHRPAPIRWCGCGPDCCEECHDRAAEGRSLSERCKKRQQRMSA